MKEYFVKKRPKILKTIIPVLIFATIILALNLFGAGAPTASQRFLANLILILGFIPAVIVIWNDETGIPFLPLFGLMYNVYYAFPVFILKEYKVRYVLLSQYALDNALMYVFLGLMMVLTTYYLIPGKSIGKFFPRISISWDPQKARLWAMCFGVIGLMFSYLLANVSIPAQFTQIILFLAELSLVSIGILFILQLQGRLDMTGKVLLWGVFLPVLLLIRMGTGAIAQLMMIFIFLSFTYWYFRKKIPWLFIVIVGLVFVFLSSTKLEYRRSMQKEKIYAEKNTIEKGILFAKMTFQNNEALQKGCTFVSTRTAHCLMTFAQVVRLTPETIPFWNGKTYFGLLWAPFPRIICPWKPRMELGQEFGHRYDFLHPTDHTSSYNLPQLVEMYINFGIVGVVIGMLLVGTIYRLLYEMFCHAKAGEGGLLIGLMVFMKISLIECDFSGIFGTIVYSIILLVIVNKLIEKHA